MALPVRRRRDEEGFWSLPALKRDMDTLLNEFFEGFWPTSYARSEFPANLDIAETENDIVVKADLPGLSPDEVDISITGDVLTIKGEKKHEKEEKDKAFHRIERCCGSFCRSVRLPSYVAVDKVKAASKDGVLTVTLPKKEEAKPKSIKINVK